MGRERQARWNLLRVGSILRAPPKLLPRLLDEMEDKEGKSGNSGGTGMVEMLLGYLDGLYLNAYFSFYTRIVCTCITSNSLLVLHLLLESINARNTGKSRANE